MIILNKNSFYTMTIFFLSVLSGVGYGFLNGSGIIVYYFMISIISIISILLFSSKAKINIEVVRVSYVFLWLIPSVAITLFAFDKFKHLGDLLQVFFTYKFHNVETNL